MVSALLLLTMLQAPVEDADRLIELAELRRDSSLLQQAENVLKRSASDSRTAVSRARLVFVRSEFVRAAKRSDEADRLLDSAIDEARDALEKTPSAGGYALLADMLGRKIGLGGFFTVLRHRGGMEDAIERAQKLGPMDAEVHLAVGRNRYHTPSDYGGSTDEAIKTFRRAAELAPHRAIAWFWLGRALERAGSRAEAIVHYRKALDIEGDYLEARTRLTVLSKNSQ
jgi:tetratricopeptide (TPR) repeat protein